MKLKKILAICLGIFILVGCTNTNNTPSKKVEDFLSKYQKLDDDVLTQLDLTLDNDQDMSDDQKKDYRALMEKQYQNLSYKIKNEETIGDISTVSVEIEVLDYATSISNSKKYFLEHRDEFKESNNINEKNIDKNSSYIDYKLEKLKEVKDKTKYELIFELEKNDNSWKIKNLNDLDRRKIHGLY